jgi:nucleotide-binding universal stress UspA family protein
MSKRILIPTDFSEASLAAVRDGLRLAEAREGMVVLLHVVEGDPVRRYLADGPMPLLREYMDLERGFPARPLRQRVVYHDLCEEAQWKLAALFPRESQDRVQPIVTVGTPAREIVRVAREQHIDLIIMGVPNRRGLRRWFRRTVVEKVRRKAPIPVITVEAQQRGPGSSSHQMRPEMASSAVVTSQ